MAGTQPALNAHRIHPLVSETELLYEDLKPLDIRIRKLSFLVLIGCQLSTNIRELVTLSAWLSRMNIANSLQTAKDEYITV